MYRIRKTEDFKYWDQVEAFYSEAFGPTAKPRSVIQNMFRKKMCSLYLLEMNGAVMAFGLAGMLEQKLLLIDYLAVHSEARGKGYGSELIQSIIQAAEEDGNVDGIVLEVVADDEGTISFWEKNGFSRTSYIHQYKWVPEPYIALYRELKQGVFSSASPQILFEFIAKFHADSFKKQKN
ncbi:hypothetical protein A8F94_01475 [Bacillus sp. FJAT-27225]|uniref:GNAT family N-acetyltransferase n=1 Tax=Bacillus sp. FJAT-27225 TaxID=1743144 RepID=UPI00080C2417|nr:GNAT family N-acetyltransferase [Bacillus sp. FJAT-27225]OCA90580.1 hypothetical protein A8F94_01475 [Bacillus sp. FJAT-27225]